MRRDWRQIELAGKPTAPSLTSSLLAGKRDADTFADKSEHPRQSGAPRARPPNRELGGLEPRLNILAGIVGHARFGVSVPVRQR